MIRRGLLLFGTLTELQSAGAVLERRRFCFPEVFASLLPAPFKVSKLSTAAVPQYRRELLRQKVTEILPEAAASSAKAGSEEGRWRLAEGELLFGGQPFRMERLEAWRARQFEVAVGYTNKALPTALLPVPLLRYALSRLREDEWLAPSEVLPLWKMVMAGVEGTRHGPSAKLASNGLARKGRTGGGVLLPFAATSRRRAGFAPRGLPGCAGCLVRVRICLEHTPLAALARLGEIFRLEAAGGDSWARPNLLKISHAPDKALIDPMVLLASRASSGFSRHDGNG